MNIFWLILSLLLWGLLHSLLASHSAKKLTQRFFGAVERRFYRLAYNLFTIISFAPILAISALTPDRALYAIPFPWFILPLAGQVLAVIALIIAFRQTDAWEFLGLRQLVVRKTARPETMRLVTTGLYRYVRHPLYTAGLAFIWLMPYMTLNLLAINISLTVYIIIGAYFEERKLRREFGAQYLAYQSLTPMLIPGLRLRRNQN